MTIHFQELTGVSLKVTFLNSVNKKGKWRLDFMRTLSADKTIKISGKEENIFHYVEDT